MNYVNMTNQNRKLNDGEVGGQVYFLTMGDALETTVISLAKGKGTVKERAQEAYGKVQEDIRKANKPQSTSSNEPKETREGSSNKQPIV